ncbi:hypothetical protein ABZ894_31430 [Nocardia beijingensis]
MTIPTRRSRIERSRGRHDVFGRDLRAKAGRPEPNGSPEGY